MLFRSTGRPDEQSTQPVRQVFFLGSRPVANRLTRSSRLLANDSVFGIFGAFVQVGSSPGALDRFGEWF